MPPSRRGRGAWRSGRSRSPPWPRCGSKTWPPRAGRRPWRGPSAGRSDKGLDVGLGAQGLDPVLDLLLGLALLQHVGDPLLDLVVGDGALVLALEQLDDVVAEGAQDDRGDLVLGLQGEGGLLERFDGVAARDPGEIAPLRFGAGVVRALGGELGEVLPLLQA